MTERLIKLTDCDFAPDVEWLEERNGIPHNVAVYKSAIKLAAYEDIGSVEELAQYKDMHETMLLRYADICEGLAKYKQAEAEGRLVIIPVGICDDCIHEGSRSCNACSNNMEAIKRNNQYYPRHGVKAETEGE